MLGHPVLPKTPANQRAGGGGGTMTAAVTHLLHATSAPLELSREIPLLQVRGLSKRFGAGCTACELPPTREQESPRCPTCGSIWACRSLDFHVYPGEILGVVGE